MKKISEEELKRRFLWENADEVMNVSGENNITICLFAHFGNWEWSIGRFIPCKNNKAFTFYSPLHNNDFDKWINNVRSRFGNKLIQFSDVSNTLDGIYKNGQKCIINAAIDQLPKEKYVRHFCRFLGIKSRVITGTEKLIYKYNMNVFYCNVKRVKRGYYVCKSERLCFNEQLNGSWPYTDAYFERLQQQIILQPELWLWTHNRWKR